MKADAMYSNDTVCRLNAIGSDILHGTCTRLPRDKAQVLKPIPSATDTQGNEIIHYHTRTDVDCQAFVIFTYNIQMTDVTEQDRAWKITEEQQIAAAANMQDRLGKHPVTMRYYILQFLYTVVL